MPRSSAQTQTTSSGLETALRPFHGKGFDAGALNDWLAGLATVPVRPGTGQNRGLLSAILPEPDAGLEAQLLALVAERRKPAPAAAPPGPAEQANRLEALRAELKRQRLDAFIVPRADRFQGEQVPPGDDRLAWLTGFTGSAGAAVIAAGAAALVVDGRYTLQVRQQSSEKLYRFPEYGSSAVADFLTATLASGAVVGFDPWLHTDASVKRLAASLESHGLQLKPVTANPLDKVWPDRPAAPLGAFEALEESHAGEASADKRLRLAEKLTKQNCAAHLLCQPDGIAWLLNIRGRDVPNSPLPLGFAVLNEDGSVALFTDPRKLSAPLWQSLGNQVSLHDEGELEGWLADLVKRTKGKRISLDPAATPRALTIALEKAKAVLSRQSDPVEYAKAVKNSAEQSGMREAHLRDGVAICRFLHWLETAALAEGATELTAVERLRQFRMEVDGYVDDSFDAIAGMGSNGAIVHYRATPATDKPLSEGGLFLIDSGGQFPDGTTDITRTVAMGRPSAQMCLHYTLVLRAHLAVAMARFPKGTSGAALDAFARQPLWARGLDFDHGTGHGVGCFLNVHEGPQRLSKASHDVALVPGMIVSNEPGYYRAGEYGIRIENLVLVEEQPQPGDERTMYGFESLTLAPFDRHLIIAEMLTPAEQSWIDAYHARVFNRLSPLMEPDMKRWLATATQPV